jgi:hypothetical protein
MASLWQTVLFVWDVLEDAVVVLAVWLVWVALTSVAVELVAVSVTAVKVEDDVAVSVRLGSSVSVAELVAVVELSVTVVALVVDLVSVPLVAVDVLVNVVPVVAVMVVVLVIVALVLVVAVPVADVAVCVVELPVADVAVDVVELPVVDAVVVVPVVVVVAVLLTAPVAAELLFPEHQQTRHVPASPGTTSRHLSVSRSPCAPGSPIAWKTDTSAKSPRRERLWVLEPGSPQRTPDATTLTRSVGSSATPATCRSKLSRT